MKHSKTALPTKTFLLLFTIGSLFLVSSCQETSESAVGTSSVAPAPPGMVSIPAGDFLMGGKTAQADPDELPRRKVHVDAFYLDATEVTNHDFAAFVEATGYQTVAERAINWQEMAKTLPPGTPKPEEAMLAAGSLVFTPTAGPVHLQNVAQWWRWTTGANWQHPEGPDSNIKERMNYPVVHIAWEDAVAYAEWADKRLPTEAEWEWAAMGGRQNAKYPLGDQAITEAADKANFWQGAFPYHNTKADGHFSAAPVKTYPPNGYSLYEMAGNVWEWTSDKYHYQAYRIGKNAQVTDNPQGPQQSFDPQEPNIPKRSMRGGFFNRNAAFRRVPRRDDYVKLLFMRKPFILPKEPATKFNLPYLGID